ncbi:MAG: S9 family peptidase [Gemmatimonadales bacterium]|nr:MAG: S9 family peptidase [Gemmatimonadales bacterium]
MRPPCRSLLPTASGHPRVLGVILLTLAAVSCLLPAQPAEARQSQEVTLEALLAPPFPYGIRAAPAGGAVAWIQNDRGERNIWVAEAPAYTGRPLTRYRGDDGQELSIADWTPDGRSLLFVRGGGPNRQGEIPNPTSDPAGAEQALWFISLDGDEPRRLTNVGNAVVAPDGERYAFTRGGDIWVGAVEGGDPERVATVRGGPGQLAWSPDGSRLAFTSSRGTHAFVGVLELEEGVIRWMDPGVDGDRHPVWSPDGDRLAFARIAASSASTSFRPLRETHPWSIRVADPATGESREVWRARAGVGSRFWGGVNMPNQLLWGDGDRLVFAWEGSGWLNLYAVSVAGGEAVALATGPFEVADAILSPDGRYVVYSSNQDDIDRRHLWRVPVAGGTPEFLTAGEGIEWEPVPLSEGGIAFLRSGARTPGHAAILDASDVGAGSGDRARPLIPRGAPGGVPDDFPDHRLVVPEPVMIPAQDGMVVPGQLFLPPDLAPGERRPAIAYFHGGSRRQMLLGFHDRIYYHHAYALNQYLALQGYVVLSVNFRSGTGYGMEFREALNYGAAGGSEFQDVTGAGLWLRARPDVDPDRIGLWGGSYGGYLTALGLARASELFAAGVDVHGVHDWNVGIATFRPDYNPLADPEKTRIAFEASPMAHLDSWRSPVLLIHGDDDRNVRFVETVDLVEALREREVETEVLVFPDEVHSFLLHTNWLRAYEATADFFGRRLSP